MLKERDFEEQEDVFNRLDQADACFLDILRHLRSVENSFVMKRDQNLIKKLLKLAEYGANKCLLVKGRIKMYELGTDVFFKQESLGFHFRLKKLPRNLHYVKLIKTNYKGKKFSNFMKKDLGAYALVGTIDNKQVISEIYIPKNKRKLIIRPK